jgi:hypothetical protein
MTDLIKNKSGGFVSLLHQKNGEIDFPKPFERDIFLFDTHVAGTTFITGIEELAPHLNINDKLDFFREPDNPHDSKAIVIRNSDGIEVGYVPQADNLIFSRLMDAGKLLFGRISAKEIRGKWLKLDIKVYLHE